MASWGENAFLLGCNGRGHVFGAGWQRVSEAQRPTSWQRYACVQVICPHMVAIGLWQQILSRGKKNASARWRAHFQRTFVWQLSPICQVAESIFLSNCFR